MNRGEVTHAYCLVILVLGFSEKDDHGIGCIAKVDPLETSPLVIEFVQRRFLAIETVKVSYQPLNSRVPIEITEMPFQTGVVAPLTPLSDFSSHEQHFFARVPVHKAIERTEVGKALPVVTGHFLDQ